MAPSRSWRALSSSVRPLLIVCILTLILFAISAILLVEAQGGSGATTSTTKGGSGSSSGGSGSGGSGSGSSGSGSGGSGSGGATTASGGSSGGGSGSGGSGATTTLTTTTQVWTPIPDPSLGVAECQRTVWSSPNSPLNVSTQETLKIVQTVPKGFIPGMTWEFQLQYTIFVERQIVVDLIAWDGWQWRYITGMSYHAKPNQATQNVIPPVSTSSFTVFSFDVPDDPYTLQFLSFNATLRVWSVTYSNWQANGTNSLWFANCLQYYNTSYQYYIKAPGQFSSVATYSTVHQNCLLLLNEYLQPYWLVFFTAFISQGIGLFAYLILKNPRGEIKDGKYELRPRNFFRSAFPKFFLTASLAFQFAQIIYIMSTVVNDANGVGFVNDVSVWARYELLFLRILNSGVPLPLISALVLMSGVWRRVDSDYDEIGEKKTVKGKKGKKGAKKGKAAKGKGKASKKGAVKAKKGLKGKGKKGSNEEKKESIRMKRLGKKKPAVSKLGRTKKINPKKKSTPPAVKKAANYRSRRNSAEKWADFVIDNYSYVLPLLTMLICILLLPFVLTHFFTGLSVFAWVWILAFGVLAGLTYLFQKYGQNERDFLPFVYRILVVCSLSVLLNMLYVYSVLVYSGPAMMSFSDYLNVISTDAQMRDSLCYMDGLSTSSRVALSFASFFFN